MFGFILILQTIIIIILIGKLNLNFWLSFIIFLIFIGGILILFIYVVSIIINKIKKQQINFIYFFLKIVFLLIILIYYINSSYHKNYETIIFNFLIQLNNETSINLLKLYNIPNLIINLILIIYLFIIIIICSKITNFHLGPFFKF